MLTTAAYLQKYICDQLQIVEDLAFGSDVSLRTTGDEY